MKELKFNTSRPVNLTPTGLEKNLPIVGFAKYTLRTRNNPDQDFMAERDNQIKNLIYRHYGIILGVGIPATALSILLNYQ